MTFRRTLQVSTTTCCLAVLLLLLLSWQEPSPKVSAFTLSNSQRTRRMTAATQSKDEDFCEKQQHQRRRQQQQQQQRTMRSSWGGAGSYSKPFHLPFLTRLFVSLVSSTSKPMEDEAEFTVMDDDEEELLLMQELEGDEEDYVEIDENQKEEWMKELRHLAKTTSQDAQAVQKAQDVFDDMFEAYVMTEETTMWPQVDVYNLLLETHAYSKDPQGADHAEKLLSRMEDPSVEFIARPNLETYLCVMDAWAMRRNPTQSEQVLKRLEQRYEETGDADIRPTADVYNKLNKAHGIVGNVEKAEEIFASLLEKEDEDPLHANYKSWVQIMKAFASQPNGVEKVQSLFRELQKAYRMGDESLKPTTDAYNAVIRALGQDLQTTEEAEQMLFDMVGRFRSGEEAVRPNGETFRSVLAALRRRKNQVSGAKVEQLLQIQEGLYATTNEEDLKLDGRLYNIALYTISRSRDAKKAVRARRMVNKMKEINDGQINVRTYFNLLSASAHTNGTPEEKLEAFQIAVDALKELREELGREPDSSCFAMFLKACANLMPESRKRDAVVSSVFKKCCSDGLVDDFVLSEFERASSQALQLELLGGFLEDDVRIPDEWSKNVEGVDEA